MPFDIKVDRGAALVTFRRSGFFTLEEVEQYRLKSAACVRELKLPSFSVICDISQAEVLSQEAAQHIADNVKELRARGAKCVAYVGGSTLEKMQVRRISSGAAWLKMFDDLASAKAWIASECAQVEPRPMIESSEP